MMSTARKSDFISVEDYLAGEQHSSVKHEYVAGLIFAMVGARNAHNIIASNALGSLFGQLQGKPCRAFNSDTKIRVQMSNQTRFYYPDVSVICRQNPQTDVFQDLPSVIIEVLSESTRRIDDGEKREAYQTIPTLTHYILLEQSTVGAVVYERTSAGFQRRVLAELKDIIPLPELNIKLSMAAVYDGVEFSEE
jgi:Uma2 family endonuclease